MHSLMIDLIAVYVSLHSLSYNYLHGVNTLHKPSRTHTNTHTHTHTHTHTLDKPSHTHTHTHTHTHWINPHTHTHTRWINPSNLRTHRLLVCLEAQSFSLTSPPLFKRRRGLCS